MVNKTAEVLIKDCGLDLLKCQSELQPVADVLEIPEVEELGKFVKELDRFSDLACASDYALGLKKRFQLESDITKSPVLLELTSELSIPVLHILRDVIVHTANSIYMMEIYNSNLDIEIAIDLYDTLPEYRNSVQGAMQIIIESLYCNTKQWQQYNDNQKIIFIHKVSLALLKGALHSCSYVERDYQ